ncbi:hypothetical protein SAMN04487981_104157 [Streptomyces sp. cf386]|uniref:hypothetical protein n=1 Tax=Streptomyces sp. cf386 TaxID=1761904 RepID=UPI00088D7BD3|nr:hypothetical protein [Streptomyces sp. cf386]SDN23378.1 hypothetical protein SAMN04487981_104157 [Streptomyces sp. cf386]
MILLAAGVLLTGCSAQGADAGPSRQSGSPSAGASPSASGAATPSSGSSAASSVFTPDPSLVPESSTDGTRLAESVVLGPGDWGRGFVAQSPAVSAPGTWAVLEESCRWRREKLPRGVLASTSRYSRLLAGSGKSEVKVTAVATVHASVLGADEQLSTTLEEVLRCPEQRPRSNERITGLMSLGTPFGAREQEYADDSVLEAGQFTEDGGAAQQYLWMVARLGTVVVAASVTGGAGHTQEELQQLGGKALAQMLTRVEQRLKGK